MAHGRNRKLKICAAYWKISLVQKSFLKTVIELIVRLNTRVQHFPIYFLRFFRSFGKLFWCIFINIFFVHFTESFISRPQTCQIIIFFLDEDFFLARICCNICIMLFFFSVNYIINDWNDWRRTPESGGKQVSNLQGRGIYYGQPEKSPLPPLDQFWNFSPFFADF